MEILKSRDERWHYSPEIADRHLEVRSMGLLANAANQPWPGRLRSPCWTTEEEPASAAAPSDAPGRRVCDDSLEQASDGEKTAPEACIAAVATRSRLVLRSGASRTQARRTAPSRQDAAGGNARVSGRRPPPPSTGPAWGPVASRLAVVILSPVSPSRQVKSARLRRYSCADIVALEELDTQVSVCCCQILFSRH